MTFVRFLRVDPMLEFLAARGAPRLGVGEANTLFSKSLSSALSISLLFPVTADLVDLLPPPVTGVSVSCSTCCLPPLVLSPVPLVAVVCLVCDFVIFSDVCIAAADSLVEFLTLPFGVGWLPVSELSVSSVEDFLDLFVCFPFSLSCMLSTPFVSESDFLVSSVDDFFDLVACFPFPFCFGSSVLLFVSISFVDSELLFSSVEDFLVLVVCLLFCFSCVASLTPSFAESSLTELSTSSEADFLDFE